VRLALVSQGLWLKRLRYGRVSDRRFEMLRDNSPGSCMLVLFPHDNGRVREKGNVDLPLLIMNGLRVV
jgi:hypothetical protein